MATIRIELHKLRQPSSNLWHEQLQTWRSWPCLQPSLKLHHTGNYALDPAMVHWHRLVWVSYTLPGDIVQGSSGLGSKETTEHWNHRRAASKIRGGQSEGKYPWPPGIIRVVLQHEPHPDQVATSCQEVQYWPIGRETVYNGWSRLTWYRAHGRTYMVVASSLTKSTCFSAHLTSNAYYMWKDTEILYSNNPAHMVYGMHYFSVLSNMVTAHVSPSGQFKLILSFSGQFYCTPGLVSQQEMVISVASPATKSLLTLYSLILHVFTISLQY